MQQFAGIRDALLACSSPAVPASTAWLRCVACAARQRDLKAHHRRAGTKPEVAACAAVCLCTRFSRHSNFSGDQAAYAHAWRWLAVIRPERC